MHSALIQKSWTHHRFLAVAHEPSTSHIVSQPSFDCLSVVEISLVDFAFLGTIWTLFEGISSCLDEPWRNHFCLKLSSSLLSVSYFDTFFTPRPDARLRSTLRIRASYLLFMRNCRAVHHLYTTCSCYSHCFINSHSVHSPCREMCDVVVVTHSCCQNSVTSTLWLNLWKWFLMTGSIFVDIKRQITCLMLGDICFFPCKWYLLLQCSDGSSSRIQSIPCQLSSLTSAPFYDLVLRSVA